MPEGARFDACELAPLLTPHSRAALTHTLTRTLERGRAGAYAGACVGACVGAGIIMGGRAAGPRLGL